MSDKLYETNKDDATIEDIIKSIRGIIDNNTNNLSSNPIPTDNNNITDDILELTSISCKDPQDYLISDRVKTITKSEINKLTDAITKGYISDKDRQLELLITNLMKPLIKTWLDDNLPKIVNNIVSEEIKRIIPK